MFTWPTIASDVLIACESCHQCHRKRWATVCDRVSIIPIKKDKVTGSTVPVDFQGRENPELTQDNQDTQDYAMSHTDKAKLLLLLFLVCVSFTIIGQPRNSVLIRRV